VALDASGLMLTRPDSFMPPVDIVLEDGFYTIYMDVPGLSAKDISLARQNVITIIKGSRSVPYLDTQTVDKQERKYGDFTMTFNIPHDYERKWDSCHVENGVLCIKFRRDTDDSEKVVEHGFAAGITLADMNDDDDDGSKTRTKQVFSNAPPAAGKRS